MLELVDEYRTNLLEAISDQDDELMMKYLEGEEISRDEIISAIRKGNGECANYTRSMRFFL